MPVKEANQLKPAVQVLNYWSYYTFIVFDGDINFFIKKRFHSVHMAFFSYHVHMQGNPWIKEKYIVKRTRLFQEGSHTKQRNAISHDGVEVVFTDLAAFCLKTTNSSFKEHKLRTSSQVSLSP